MSDPRLTLRGIRARAVDVPMKLPLGTSAATIRSAPLMLIDIETEEGITGRSYLFCYLPAAGAAIAAMLGEIERAVKGDRIAPERLWAKLARRFRLIGVQGIVRMAMSGLDCACWDALAIAAAKPLVALLGGAPRRIRAYNSNGLGLMEPGAAADEAEKLLEGGFRAVKLRLGYPTLAADLAAVRAVRKRLPDRIELMVDYNQALSFAEALERGRALESEGVAWIEEPIRHDDFRSCSELARELATPIQIGENFSLPEQMSEALLAKACDFVMPDLERIGGVTGWQRAAALAAERRLPMSSHLFPETSAHLLAVTSTCHYLEYVDWADAILAEPLKIADGEAVIPDRPGTGVSWNEDAVKRYLIA
ncbi:MAG TPA: enolase C-terminal domain-like protein [Burkholderiales bacterium]|nr:enolase C-terminal domain-like protein [Burkholderiales bacterium]